MVKLIDVKDEQIKQEFCINITSNSYGPNALINKIRTYVFIRDNELKLSLYYRFNEMYEEVEATVTNLSKHKEDITNEFLNKLAIKMLIADLYMNNPKYAETIDNMEASEDFIYLVNLILFNPIQYMEEFDLDDVNLQDLFTQTISGDWYE